MKQLIAAFAFAYAAVTCSAQELPKFEAVQKGQGAYALCEEQGEEAKLYRSDDLPAIMEKTDCACAKPQQIVPFQRKGFTVVEWGGAELRPDSKLIQ